MRIDFRRYLLLAVVALVGGRAARAENAIPLEYSFDVTYVGDASVQTGHLRTVDFDENDTVLRLLLTPRTSLGILRLGFAYERFDFGFGENVHLPNRLQSASAIVGIDLQLSDSILLRVEAQPGIYAHDLDDPGWNAPFLIGGSYIFTPDFQFILGVGVDVERKYPVLPGCGIRWRFQPRWVLNAILPDPRLEFQVTKNLTAYLGVNYKETNFRMDSNFGNQVGDRRLNNAVLTYSEMRTGTGAEWKITNWLTLNAEAGYQPYRSFDFYRVDVRYHENGGAPYGMIALHGAF